MKKICFCTYVSDKYYHSMGADKLVKSARYFHPTIPMVMWGDDVINEFPAKFGFLHPHAIKKAMEEYETVIYIDADSIITGKLTELLEAIKEPYDIIGVRNNNDLHKAGMDEPFAQPGAGTEHYLNGGMLATSNRAFIDEWIDHNNMYGSMLAFGEQTTLNALAQKYKTYMVDGYPTEVYYGVSALYGEKTHWDSWMDIEVIDKELVLNNKKVKVLHHAGGTKMDKLSFYMFNDETRKRLIEITK